MTVQEIYAGSDGAATRSLYAELERRGPIGILARYLLTAQKASERAKVYRGGIRGVGSYRSLAYDKKNWSLEQLAAVLSEHGAQLGIAWGWKEDPAQEFHNQVLYVDLPTGQVSFHASSRGKGPDYPGDWDEQHKSAERIVAWVEQVREGRTVPVKQEGIRFKETPPMPRANKEAVKPEQMGLF
jgi:hypothetical protein